MDYDSVYYRLYFVHTESSGKFQVSSCYFKILSKVVVNFESTTHAQKHV